MSKVNKKQFLSNKTSLEGSIIIKKGNFEFCSTKLTPYAMSLAGRKFFFILSHNVIRFCCYIEKNLSPSAQVCKHRYQLVFVREIRSCNRRLTELIST